MIPKITGPAARYTHTGHTIRNINHEFKDQLTTGQRIADLVAKTVGSWPFIIYQSIVIVIWMAANVYLGYKLVYDASFFKAWDPYPFILLNLILSFQAAYTGPVVMMSQNRQSEKDRMMAEQDYNLNKKAEEEIKVIMEHLVHQDTVMAEILAQLERIEQRSEVK